MDVTNENFIELLPQISQTIKQCDFIAIDTELSGLMRERSLNRFDLPDERFSKAFESSRGYFIMQFGLSCFTKLENGLEFDNRTYNFYIFPQPHEGYGDIDRTFSLQAHAIQFLSSNNFDFNKLFKHGISYLTFEEKRCLSAKLKAEIKIRYKKDKETIEQEKLESEERNRSLVRAKGFLQVLEQVILNKKPIVGHNLAIDLIQIINQFIEPLNEDYTSFKETCHSLFPIIYDTKFIAHSIFESECLTNNQSRLNDLFCELRDSECEPKVIINHLNEFHDDNQSAHQAGYDAYMSGYCFIQLCQSFLSENRKCKSKKGDPDQEPASLAQDYRILNEFSNKIHLAYSYDFKHFNLSGDEEKPDRSHLFYMEFPATWALEDIFQVFQSLGGVTVGRMSKTSAICALREPKKLDSTMKKLESLKKTETTYRIYPYDTYLERFKYSNKNEPVN